MNKNISLEKSQKKILEVEQENRLLKKQISDLTLSKEKEKKYKFISNAAADFMTLINNNYIYEAVNNSYCHEHSKTQQDFIGKSVSEVWGEKEFRNNIKANLDACFSGEKVQYQSWFRFANQGDGYYNVSYYPYYGENGKITHVAVITSNITSQKLTEIALRKSEERFRGIAEGSFDMIFILDTQGNFSYVSKASKRIYGYEPKEIINKNFSDIFLDYNNNKVINTINNMLKGNKVEILQLNLKKKNGEIAIVEINALPIVDSGKIAGSQGIVRDLTERKKLEARQRNLEFQLIKEHRLSSIGVLTSGITHNINNPLTVIFGALDIIEAKNPNLMGLDMIRRGAERIGAIVNTLMKKCRRDQEEQRKKININDLLLTELNLLEADLDFKNEVIKEYHFGENIPDIIAVYSDFSQGLLNIIRNSIDAMYNRDEKKLLITTCLNENYIKLTITDTGCGISEENLSKLFDPFFTTKPTASEVRANEPKGTGLGLYSCFQLLNPYGVKIEVDSKLNKGTTFTIKIPFKETKK